MLPILRQHTLTQASHCSLSQIEPLRSMGPDHRGCSGSYARTVRKWLEAIGVPLCRVEATVQCGMILSRTAIRDVKPSQLPLSAYTSIRLYK
jgi:hypothetical protein